MTHEELLTGARQRLQDTAGKLCKLLDPLDVAGSFLAIGAVLLVAAIGPEKAAEYLRELSDEILAKEGGGSDALH
ncbi:hypothetical protein H0I76_09925 [Limibaculum sp. M0105]|uniref:Uncharacterized protein n=1 Tax=Thermohalobaculum xanthum TaxID=2753746 RepID=A0A8J7M700_9RHOB|nr:hypothetical protein [Thermohalobaculum xanthum]MBK0399509.1 hypothetical protein [Thermohalobaculum xanthum]